MTDEFRDCFVGEKGYDVLKKLMKNGNDFCADVAKCLQERSDAEMIYSRALRKTSDTLEKIAGRAKGTLAQAFMTLSSQTGKEADGHSLIAQALLNDIVMPMKNLAESQTKDRRSIEDTLNGKFREWNSKKEVDYKYRLRQIEKCREIETLANKISEVSNSSKLSSRSKANSVSTPLVMSCVPVGRYASVSDKPTYHSDTKHHSHLEASMKKAEEELEKIERKYHASTKDVELLRQNCDIEMQRSCDQLQQMEFDRIIEIDHCMKGYIASIQSLSETTHQITQELRSIQISANDDIIIQARSNVQPAELEILLYDIYAENKDSVMSDQRRILSLMKWMELLKRDIEIQQQAKNKSSSSLFSSSTSHMEKSNEEDDDDDDDDGAMCSTSIQTRTDVVRNTIHRESSSSSSNDGDGGMYHSKRNRKKNEGVDGSSSEVVIDRRGVTLLEQLYRASLFKIERVYNSIKHLSEPTYEHSQRLTKTYSDKGCPITLLRLPIQSSIPTPASAPSTVQYITHAVPMIYTAGSLQQSAPYPMARQAAMPVAYAMQAQAPPAPGWTVNAAPLSHAAPDTQSTSTDKYVRVLHKYKAQHKDELNLQPGDLIMLLERREDGWCKGKLNGKVGLFPGNHTQEI